MFKVMIDKGVIHTNMPGDVGITLFDACWRADIYKRHNPTATFTVVNMINGDIEYRV